MIGLIFNKKLRFFMAFFCLGIFGSVMQLYGQSNTNPSWINDFPPENELWGIGVAKLVNSRNSMNLAELRARSSIVQQIYSKTSSRQNDNEFNDLYLFFTMYISMEGSFEIMNATKVLRTWVAPDGTSWCLIALQKSDATKYISIIEKMYQEYYDNVFKK